MSVTRKIWKFLAFTDEEKVKFSFAIIMAIVAASMSFYEKHEKDIEREKSQTYEKQVERLSNIQDSVKDLAEFVSQQQKQLEASRDTLQNLENERKKLEPVVQADRQVVEAILKLQADQERSSVWLERGIGFLLGIAGSLIASIIFTVVRKRMSARSVEQNA
jgi:predicted negative regulator of RcsB-dependent stress response